MFHGNPGRHEPGGAAWDNEERDAFGEPQYRRRIGTDTEGSISQAHGDYPTSALELCAASIHDGL